MSKKTTNYPTQIDEPTAMVAEAALVYESPLKRVTLARQGLTTSYVIDLMERLHLSKLELAKLISISSKTLDRHLQSGKIFSGLQADRLLSLAELFLEGVHVFGTREKFLKWLNSELPALEGTSPKSWLDTQHGIDLISDEIGRIQHGIFA